MYGPDGQRITCQMPATAPDRFELACGVLELQFRGRLISTEPRPNAAVEDRLGTTAVAYDSRASYYPYGELRRSGLYGRRFATYPLDSVSNLNYAMNRYYSSQLMRFTTPDPSGGAALGMPQSWNRYAYVGGDPVNKNDPTGLMPCVDSIDYPWCEGAWGVGNPQLARALFYGNATWDSESGWDAANASWAALESTLFGSWNFAGGAGTGGTGGGGRSPKECNNKEAVNFVKSNLEDARTLASALKVPVQFVLAAAANESEYGQYPTAIAANNFFGIHAGKVAIANGSTGPYKGNPIFAAWAPGTDGFLWSGNAFVRLAKSDKATGLTDATQFFTAIHAQFGVGTPTYVSDMLKVVNAVTIRIDCP